MTKHQGHFEGVHGDSLKDVRGYQEKTARYLAPLAVGRVLDVGASEGYLGKCLPFAKSYEAIDINPRDPCVRKGTICAAEGAAYDLIVYCHVLEHVLDPIGELTKARKLLDKNGFVFVAVPLAPSFWSYAYEGHLWMFNEETLPRVASHAGLTVKDTMKVNFRRDCDELWVLMSH